MGRSEKFVPLINKLDGSVIQRRIGVSTGVTIRAADNDLEGLELIQMDFVPQVR